MDFVKHIEGASHLQDVIVDDIGRAEVYGGRVRITLCRVIEDAEGNRFYGAVVPLVWTLESWKGCHGKREMLRTLIDTNGAPIVRERASALHH